MNGPEKIIFSNSFGTVTDQRLTLNYLSGAEDVVVDQIDLIEFQHKRNYLFAIGSFLAVVPLLTPLFITDLIHKWIIAVDAIIILFAILSGIANWIGHHNIIVVVGGQVRKPIRVEMSKTQAGREFVDAVRTTYAVGEMRHFSKPGQ